MRPRARARTARSDRGILRDWRLREPAQQLGQTAGQLHAASEPPLDDELVRGLLIVGATAGQAVVDHVGRSWAITAS